MDYEQAFSTSNIQLEPRLLEYINRKTFNRENDIRPDIPEDKEFSITMEDRDIIKRYMRGRSAIYSKKRTGNKSHFVQPAPCTDDFFSNKTGKNAFQNDPRFKRLQKKMESHKNARAQIANLDGIDEGYEIFHRSNPYDDPSNPNVVRPTRIMKPYDDPSNNDSDDDYMPQNTKSRGIYRKTVLNNNSPEFTMMDSRDLVLGSSKGDANHSKYMYNPNTRSGGSESSYNHRSKLSYRNTLIPEKVNGGLDHNHSIREIIGGLDEYNKHLDDTYDYIDAEVDQDTHSMRPRTRNSSIRDNYDGYKAIPYGYGGGLADISVEDSLRGGIRDSRSKSTGFRNSFEHQFDYIDSDISDPNHTVEMRPEATRGANKTIARPNSMAAKSDAKFRSRMSNEYAMENSNRVSYDAGYANARRNTDDAYGDRYRR